MMICASAVNTSQSTYMQKNSQSSKSDRYSHEGELP